MINRQPENQPVVESKYSLVVAVAKRARQIISRRDPGVVLAHKPVTIALQEIESGAVRVVPKAREVLSDVQAPGNLVRRRLKVRRSRRAHTEPQE